MFGGFGPIVLGIVCFIISLTIEDFYIGGKDVLIGIISTYVIAFVQAGATVFPQIEEWSVGRSMLVHMLSVYVVYAAAYIINSWIPFEPTVLLIFTAIFAALFLVIWLSVLLSVKAASKKFNARIK